MIHSFSCNNFRNISIKDMKLSKINVLLGPNGSGKTNFIRAITFYSNMLKHEFDGGNDSDFMNAMERNGWSHTLKNEEASGTPISFEWNMDLNNEVIKYKFSYVTGEKPESFHIVNEEMESMKREGYDRPFNYFSAHKSTLGKGRISTATHIGARNNRIQFDIKTDATICSQFKDILLSNRNIYSSDIVRKDITKLMEELERNFRSIFAYSSAQINTIHIRESAEPQISARFLNRDGSNFVNLFNTYKTRSLVWKKEFGKAFRDIMHDIEDIDVVNIYDKLVMKMIKDGHEYDLSDVSEGTIKALVLCLILNSKLEQKYSLLAIDEPENNLHPAWQKVVADWIINSNCFEQCIISTHSPDLLDRFTDIFREGGDISVYTFDNNGKIEKINYEDIRDELGQWELGDLYRTNDPVLGAWPW